MSFVLIYKAYMQCIFIIKKRDAVLDAVGNSPNMLFTTYRAGHLFVSAVQNKLQRQNCGMI